VVTPTLKAAQVAAREVGTAGSVAWLVHQHGFRWDSDGHWSRDPVPREYVSALARLLPGDLLLVDEAGMLDQDTALALVTIADEAQARVVLVGGQEWQAGNLKVKDMKNRTEAEIPIVDFFSRRSGV